jgi:hypothetical protein
MVTNLSESIIFERWQHLINMVRSKSAGLWSEDQVLRSAEAIMIAVEIRETMSVLATRIDSLAVAVDDIKKSVREIRCDGRTYR